MANRPYVRGSFERVPDFYIIIHMIIVFIHLEKRDLCPKMTSALLNLGYLGCVPLISSARMSDFFWFPASKN